MFKHKNEMIPVSIANYFQFRNISPHGYNLRSQRTSSDPQIIHRTNSGKRSIYYRGNEVWANVPDEIKTSPSANVFKKIFKSHLLLCSYKGTESKALIFFFTT